MRKVDAKDYCDGSGQRVGGRTRVYASLPWAETPSPDRGKVRCPKCNRRLQLRARFCIGGEFVAWAIPNHKPRVTRKPGPRRKSRTAGRGK